MGVDSRIFSNNERGDFAKEVKAQRRPDHEYFKLAGGGGPVTDLRRKHGMSSACFFK